MNSTPVPAASAPATLKAARLAAAALAIAAAALVLAPKAHAEDALLYVGGSIGQGNTKVGQVDFNKSDVGWKLTVGTRPIPLLGAEVSFIDLGNPSQTVGGYYQKATTKGETVFGLVYLPIPVPLVDVYGKLGLARLATTASSSYDGCQPAGPGCTPFSISRTNSQPAYGVGAQMHWGALAGRIEYEHFQTYGGSPSMLSVGLIYGFL
jgi:opacity protein-like surface antigen